MLMTESCIKIEIIQYVNNHHLFCNDIYFY